MGLALVFMFRTFLPDVHGVLVGSGGHGLEFGFMVAFVRKFTFS